VSQAVPTARRYYLLKRQAARQRFDQPLDGCWRGKQEAQPGTPLPADFPFLSQLADGGYTAEEDLAGATACELTNATDLTEGEAEAVLAALAAL
jgi:hypothetical protein